MIVSFKNQATEDIFDSKNSKAARKLCPPNLWSTACRKLDQLNAVTIEFVLLGHNLKHGM
jgi:proteic killer suppression protein